MAQEFELLNKNGKKVVISRLIYIFAFAEGVLHSTFDQSH